MDGHVIVLNPTIWLFLQTVTRWLLINPSRHLIITIDINLLLLMGIIIRACGWLRFSKFPRLWVFSIFSCLRSPPGCLLHLLSGFIYHTNSLRRFFSSSITWTGLNIPVDGGARVKILSAIGVLLIPTSWWHSSSDEFFLLMIISLFSKSVKLIHLIFIIIVFIVLITVWLFVDLALKVANGCVQWSSVAFIIIIQRIFVNVLKLALAYW